MPTHEAPLTKRERAELEGYLSWAAILVRALAFVLAVCAVGAMSWFVQSVTPLDVPLWVIIPIAFAVVLYRRARRWTGGGELRRQIRRDLEGNVAAVHRFSVVDVIRIDEENDEGPTVFVKTSAGDTLGFAGQWLARRGAHGFPWREIEIRETPHARRVLRISGTGESVRPSLVRPPLAWATIRQLGLFSRDWVVIAVDFERLRTLE